MIYSYDKTNKMH